MKRDNVEDIQKFLVVVDAKGSQGKEGARICFTGFQFNIIHDHNKFYG